MEAAEAVSKGKISDACIAGSVFTRCLPQTCKLQRLCIKNSAEMRLKKWMF